MSGIEMLAFSGAIFLLAISPGPGLLAVISKSISSGFKEASLMVAGIVTGDLIFLNLAIFGLSSLSAMGENFFSGIKYLGAIYLIYIGAMAIKSARNPSSSVVKSSSNSMGSYLLGLSITLGNPKVILFYLGFLPSFIDMAHLQKFDALIISLIVALVLGTVMLFYAYMGSHASKSMGNSKMIQIISGAMLIIVGLVVLLR